MPRGATGTRWQSVEVRRRYHRRYHTGLLCNKKPQRLVELNARLPYIPHAAAWMIQIHLSSTLILTVWNYRLETALLEKEQNP